MLDDDGVIEESTRMADYRVLINLGSARPIQCEFRISAFTGEVDDGVIYSIRGLGLIEYSPQHSDDPERAEFIKWSNVNSVLSLYSAECMDSLRYGWVSNYEINLVDNLLSGGDAVAPKFGSPPYDWEKLRDVVAHGLGGFIALGTARDIPTLVVAYGAGIVMVQFFSPIVRSIGSALGDGLAHSIRKAFDLPSGESANAISGDSEASGEDENGESPDGEPRSGD